uniref:Replication origin-binding protein n=1 Tax=Human herpesvirus 6B TaxID=32604 RepID=A0A2L2QEA9_HHV6H|nr:UL9 [Human betaherpesvirus 6B]
MENRFQNDTLFSEWFGQSLSDVRFPDNVTVYSQADSAVSFENVRQPIKLVRAAMGSGKTTALIHFLKQVPKELSVLLISCRKTFAAEILHRFTLNGLEDFELYCDITERQINNRKVIVQIESLHRLTENYDVLILDEIMSIIKQFYSKTMTKTKEVDCKFLSLIKNSSHVIAMDATLTRHVVEFFAAFKPDTQIALIRNTFMSAMFSNRVAYFCDTFFGKEFSFFARLEDKLRWDKKLCLFCSTVLAAEYMHDLIRSRFSLKKVLLLTSKQGKCSSIESWIRYDVVIYTSVVTVGLSFEPVYFSSLFVYIQLAKGGPDMVSIFQSIGRVRRVIDEDIYIYMNPVLIKSYDPLAPIAMPPCSDWSVAEQSIISESCIDFRGKCSGAHKYNFCSVLKCLFRYRHYIEKTTITSLSDSLFLLCSLLCENSIKVDIVGNGFPMRKEVFLSFLQILVEECHFIEKKITLPGDNMTFQEIISSRETIMNGDFYENGNQLLHKDYITDMGKFRATFLSPGVDIFIASDIVSDLKNESKRYVFVNVWLQKCVSAGVESTRIERVFNERIKSYVLPKSFLCDEYFVLGDISGVYEWGMLIDLAFLAEMIRKDLKLKSCTDTTTDISEDDLLLCAARRSSDILQIMQLVFTVHVQFFQRYSLQTLQLFNKLRGMRIVTGVFSIEKFSISILRLFFKCAFNMTLSASKPRYIPGKAYRNLTKNDLENMLDNWEISRTNLKTCKELRKALTEASRVRRKQTIYKLQGSDISLSVSEVGVFGQHASPGVCVSS